MILSTHLQSPGGLRFRSSASQEILYYGSPSSWFSKWCILIMTLSLHQHCHPPMTMIQRRKMKNGGLGQNQLFLYLSIENSIQQQQLSVSGIRIAPSVFSITSGTLWTPQIESSILVIEAAASKPCTTSLLPTAYCIMHHSSACCILFLSPWQEEESSPSSILLQLAMPNNAPSLQPWASISIPHSSHQCQVLMSTCIPLFSSLFNRQLFLYHTGTA